MDNKERISRRSFIETLAGGAALVGIGTAIRPLDVLASGPQAAEAMPVRPLGKTGHQSKVTSFRNIELSSYRFIGNLDLTPSLDVWVDTNYLEDYAVTIGPDGKNLPQTTTEWNDWQSKITGYYVEKQPGAHGGNDIYSPGGWFTTINHATIQNPDTLHTDQKVTEYTTSTRSGISYKYNVEEDTESLGTRVVDVSLVPYIQPQAIIVRGRGLTARTKFFTFFDGEDMTNYCTPLTEAEYTLGESIKRKVPRTYGQFFLFDFAENAW